MLQDLDRAAQQLKDAACGLSTGTACPAIMQPGLDSNGGTSTPLTGPGDLRLRSPSPRMGGSLTPVARLNSCPVPVQCSAAGPAPQVWGAFANSGRDTQVSSSTPRPMNTIMNTRGQVPQLEVCPPSIRTSLGRSHLSAAEQATNHVGIFSIVEGVASDSSSIRRLEACPSHLASKSTSSPDLQRFPRTCLASRAASPPQRASPRV